MSIIEAAPGEWSIDFYRRAIQTAKDTKEPVKTLFNGAEVTVSPESFASDIVSIYLLKLEIVGLERE